MRPIIALIFTTLVVVGNLTYATVADCSTAKKKHVKHPQHHSKKSMQHTRAGARSHSHSHSHPHGAANTESITMQRQNAGSDADLLAELSLTKLEPPQKDVNEVRVRVLANYMARYTTHTDALQTARRYVYCKNDPLNDPAIWTVMTVAESSCNRNSVSHCGAQGKLGVMPSWKYAKGFEFYRGPKSHLDDDKNFMAARKVMAGKLHENRHIKWEAVRRYCGAGEEADYYVAKIKRMHAELTKQLNMHGA